MDFHYDDYYRPSHDVVFAITFANKELFVKICSAVYGKKITIAGEPHSQAIMRENDVLLNTIRFDVMAIADNDQIFTIDIQRRYTKGRQERRGTYYMCRAVSSQPVTKMRYEELHPVHIAFILTAHKDEQKSVRKIGLCYLDSGELYDDLIELVLVYVPAVISKANVDTDNDLYLFSRFFAVSSIKEAIDFAAEFENNSLAKELIGMYNSAVANNQDLQTIESNSYFTQRLTEAQLAEERAEAEAKGKAKGKAEGKSEGIAEVVRVLTELANKGYSLDTALKMIEQNIYTKPENETAINRKQAIVSFIKKHGQTKTAEIADALGFSRSSVSALLRELIANEIVVKTGSNRNTCFTLKQ